MWLVIGISALAVAAALLIPAMAQPLNYHNFADHREALGIHNFLDVASNGAFLIVGVIGMVIALGPRARFQFTAERWPYVIFFTGVLLTAAGSAITTSRPITRQFWDRLPMTVALWTCQPDRRSIQRPCGLVY
jgi:hypothetical protein